MPKRRAWFRRSDSGGAWDSVFLIRFWHRAHFSSKAAGLILTLFLNYRWSRRCCFSWPFNCSIPSATLFSSQFLSPNPLFDQILLTLQVSAQMQLVFRKLPWTSQEDVGTSSAVHMQFLYSFFYYGTNTFHCRFLFVYFPIQRFPALSQCQAHEKKNRKF